MNRLNPGLALALFGLAAMAAATPDVQRIQNRFVAPCCWQESVAVHRSEAAAEMRAEIGQMVAAGKTEDQIVSDYVARYGERILLEPLGSKLLWLRLIPVAAVALALVGLILLIRRLRRRPPPPAATHTAALPALPDLDLD
jgi:cytochrome c-type biogenesis protein CcmH